MENPSIVSKHQFQSKKAMEKSIDRISELPDDVLPCILSLLPMKWMVRTSILSKRWRNMWKDTWANATALDFGAEFAPLQTHSEFIATVNLYLQLHKGKEIKMFQLMFNPGRKYLSDAKKWIEFAVGKRVKELDIDCCQTIYDEVWEPVEGSRHCNLPNSLFCCDSITLLNLRRCDFRPPFNFNGYTYLKTLHLYLVGITDALLESMLSSCLLLEELSLRTCCTLTRVKVSDPDLPLKSLTVVDCWNADEIEIFAPNLQSFCFYGHFISMSFKNILSLVGVHLNGIDRDCYDEDIWIPVLRHLEHVQILTLCALSLEYVYQAEVSTPEHLPITFYNLQELQLLVDQYIGDSLPRIYSFFKNCPCPCLEKLFIQLLCTVEDPSQADYQIEGLLSEDTPGIVFYHLKVIKMNGFRGLKDEMELVKFFLEKAIVLESLVLVAPKEGGCNIKKDCVSGSKSVERTRGLLHERLLNLAKASSSDAKILICEYSDDDGALAATHTEFYHLAEASSSDKQKLSRECSDYDDDDDDDNCEYLDDDDKVDDDRDYSDDDDDDVDGA